MVAPFHFWFNQTLVEVEHIRKCHVYKSEIFKAVFCDESYIQVAVRLRLELVPTVKKVLDAPVQYHCILDLISLL